LTPARIAPHLAATTKEGAIAELIGLLAAQGDLEDQQGSYEAVLARESAGATAAGPGLAIPHAKCAAARRPAVALGRPARPVPFGREEGAELIVLLLSPPACAEGHIRMLARLARLLESDGLRRRIRQATSAEDIHDLVRDRELKLY